MKKKNKKMVQIFGRVTDFDARPMANAEVEIKGANFQTLYHTYSDVNGYYKFVVKPGIYLALMACKDYKTKNLEYWAWSIPAHNNLEINPRIDGLEVYAMNAFIPQTSVRSIMLYFRPMSLKRVQKMGGIEVVKKMKSIEIAPNLSKDDIELKINDRLVQVLEINRVKESAGERKSIIGYLIQCSLAQARIKNEYFCITLTLYDRETEERGEACLFFKIPEDSRLIIGNKIK